MDSEYTNIYTGNFIIVKRLLHNLENVGINAIIKDETESGRLAGFGPAIMGNQDVYVHHSELKKAISIVEETKALFTS